MQSDIRDAFTPCAFRRIQPKPRSLWKIVRTTSTPAPNSDRRYLQFPSPDKNIWGDLNTSPRHLCFEDILEDSPSDYSHFNLPLTHKHYLPSLSPLDNNLLFHLENMAIEENPPDNNNNETTPSSARKRWKKAQIVHPKFKPEGTQVKPFSFEAREKKKRELKQANERAVRNESTQSTARGQVNKSSDTTKKTKQSDTKKVEKKKSPLSRSPKKKSPRRRSPKSPQLLTSIRAKMKQHRLQLKKERDKETENIKKKEEEDRQRKEKEEIMKLRKALEFKAQPIRKYVAPPAVKKRPLTDPISPKFAKRPRKDSISK